MFKYIFKPKQLKNKFHEKFKPITIAKQKKYIL